MCCMRHSFSLRKCIVYYKNVLLYFNLPGLEAVAAENIAKGATVAAEDVAEAGRISA